MGGTAGATFPSLYAMMAKRHMHEYGTTREQLAMFSVINHKRGIKPISQFPMEITVDQVLNSTMVTDPLRLLDCSPVTDGGSSSTLPSRRRKKYTEYPYMLKAQARPQEHWPFTREGT